MAEFTLVDSLQSPDDSADIDAVLADVVRQLHAQRDSLATPLRQTFRGQPLPSRTEIVTLVELLRSVIFPGYFGNRDVTEDSLSFHTGAILHQASLIMVDEVHRGLCFGCGKAPEARTPSACLAKATRITGRFLKRLPELRRLLALDAMAAYEGDPAASGPSEAIFCYPGVRALTSHRVAH